MNGFLLGLAVVGMLLSVGCGGSKGPDVARGEQLYNGRCLNCHAKDTDVMADLPGQGPGLKDFLRRSPHKDLSGVEHAHTEDFIRSMILNGSKNMPPQNERMPDKDLADLVAYVKTL